MSRLVVRLPLALAIAVSCLAQKATILQDFHKAVPIDVRKPFCSILQRSIVAQQREDWAALYALQLPASRTWPLDEFVRKRGGKTFKLKEFRVVEILPQIVPGGAKLDGMWDAVGCVSTQDKKDRITAKAATTIYLENGLWYAESVSFLLTHADGSLERCKMSSAVELEELCQNPGN